MNSIFLQVMSAQERIYGNQGNQPGGSYSPLPLAGQPAMLGPDGVMVAVERERRVVSLPAVPQMPFGNASNNNQMVAVPGATPQQLLMNEVAGGDSPQLARAMREIAYLEQRSHYIEQEAM